MIGQAVANLIDNAINFSNDNGHVDINLQSNKVDNIETYQISIFNRGDAIPEFALPKLYDRFFSLPPSSQSQTSTKSTGLGLSFVSEIMKLHQGHITIKNIDNGVLAELSWPKI